MLQSAEDDAVPAGRSELGEASIVAVQARAIDVQQTLDIATRQAGKGYVSDTDELVGFAQSHAHDAGIDISKKSAELQRTARETSLKQNLDYARESAKKGEVTATDEWIGYALMNARDLKQDIIPECKALWKQAREVDAADDLVKVKEYADKRDREMTDLFLRAAVRDRQELGELPADKPAKNAKHK